MKSVSLLVLGVLAMAASPLLAAPTVTVQWATSGRLAAYRRIEFDVALKGGATPYANPFNPDEIAVDATLTGPKGQTMRVPAFWYQPYKVVNGWPDMSGQTPRFRLRIAPPASGSWRLVVTAKDRTGVGTSAPLSFSAVSTASPGFVRRAPGSTRYFSFDNGKPYFLVGENVCWAGERGLQDYVEWFGSLGKAGGNFARLWMAFQPIESKATGLNRYDLKNAAYFDQVLELAEGNGICCMMAFGTYGEFNKGGYFNEGRWPENPYNAANGGPIPTATPDVFFTDPTARAAYRKRLRYLIARYSAYTSLGFWEFWNEKAGPASWFSEMAKYLKANDPYRHLVTNSYSTTGTADVWNIPEIDLTQTHRYGDEGSVRDVAPLILSDSKDHDVYKKPHLMGEFGISWRGPDDKFDPNRTATNLHNGLWSAAFSGQPGGAAIWWWDNYVHPRNLYNRFTGFARFVAQIDWPRRAFEPITIAPPIRPATATETFTDAAISCDGAWGYVQKKPSTLTPVGNLVGDALPGFLYGPEKQEMHAPAQLKVNLAQSAALRVKILTVSNKANLRISIDGKQVATFPFRADPDGPRGYESTKQFPEYGGIYQALFNKEVRVSLPAGSHLIALENTEGDWVTIGPITVEKARSSRFAALRPVALQDAKTGETLVWVQDTESNWYNDREGKKPEQWQGITLKVPVVRAGSYRIVWWHTREGRAIETRMVKSTGNAPLSLTIPTFTRDIALRITAAGR